MAADWYDKARQEFMQDLWMFNDVAKEDSDKIYAYLVNVGLIDYDAEKEFLYAEYVDDSEDE